LILHLPSSEAVELPGVATLGARAAPSGENWGHKKQKGTQKQGKKEEGRERKWVCGDGDEEDEEEKKTLKNWGKETEQGSRKLLQKKKKKKKKKEEEN
jgi:hypothetical protein